jgi:predicted nucleic acid-binding protein
LIVVDSSAIVDALVGEPVNDALLEVLATEDLHAPELLDFEVAGALRGHALGRLLDVDHASEAIRDYAGLDMARHRMTGLLGLLADFLSLRVNFTVYDAAYIVFARALPAPLLTADAKMKEATRLGVEVWFCDQLPETGEFDADT